MSDLSEPSRFLIPNRVVVITGGAGLLGIKHAEAILEIGGIPVLMDVSPSAIDAAVAGLQKTHGARVAGVVCDITDSKSVDAAIRGILEKQGRIDVLINNAANNPKVEGGSNSWMRFENFPMEVWERDFQVGVTGAFLCSQAVGRHMLTRGSGVILNILSDLALIAPDQRLYAVDGLPENEQPVKPVTYSVAKTALLGLTRYLATYWADSGIRVVALSPGGVENGQPSEFVDRLNRLIPMRRMAQCDEYKGAVQFLVSDAASYMTGSNLVIDGGRSVW